MMYVDMDIYSDGALKTLEERPEAPPPIGKSLQAK
jgi:hypothetical protein